jgi:glycosyltransferase involved in cell wall biosynthesis
VARFITGLLAGLDADGVVVDVVVKAEDEALLSEAAPGHRYHRAPARTSSRAYRLLWEQVGLPRLARRLGADAVHAPHYTFPLVLASKSVVTVHDATFFSAPEAHSRGKRLFFRTWTKLALRRAREVVAVSAATAAEVERYAGGRRRRPIRVAHLGVDGSVFHPPAPGETDALRTSLGLDEHEPYIAFLGTIEPRKSVPALIRAVVALRRADPSRPRLVVSGARGWDEEAAALLDDPRTKTDVVEAGYLPVESLHSLLGGAEVVCYPSVGEGFGLPVLEAMACGTAVLTTPRLAIPEVGGDAVEYTEPDERSIGAALSALLDDPERREVLGDAGLRRSAAFTWRACADHYLAAYRGASA